MRVHFDAYTLDVEARLLTRAGEPLHLSTKAFDLLTLLIEHRPAVVEKAACRQRLWPDVHVVDAALTNLIAEIRAVLKEGGAESYVRTVHGVGYAFGTPRRGEEDGTPRRGDTPFWLVWKGRPIVLAPGERLVGRDVACDVWVDEDGVSRKHARLRVPAGGETRTVTIEDLRSTNGTYVQGRRVTGETPLENGDRIRLGEATLVFRAQTGDAPTRRVKAPGRR